MSSIELLIAKMTYIVVNTLTMFIENKNKTFFLDPLIIQSKNNTPKNLSNLTEIVFDGIKKKKTINIKKVLYIHSFLV